MTNDFKPFAASSGANVETQAEYLADTTNLNNGFASAGAVLAYSQKCNKVWRQSSIIASIVASYIQAQTNNDVIDDGTTSTILSNLASAIQVGGYCIDSSYTQNVITATPPILPTALVDGLAVNVKVNLTNNSSVSFQLGSFTTYPVVTSLGALTGGELISQKVYTFVYQSSTSSWLLLNYQTTSVTQTAGDNSNAIATTKFVASSFAPLASPSLIGNPTAPTQALGDNTNKLATDAFVQQALSSYLPSGTRLLFCNPTAPLGWTQIIDDSVNNRLLRVVNVVGGTTGSGGSGGQGYGGSNNPINMTANDVPIHTHTASSSVTDPGHSHQYAHAYLSEPQSGSATNCLTSTYNDNTTTSTTGISVHTTVGNNTGSSNWQPKYLNMILCVRN